MLLLAFACAPESADSAAPELPGHSECLPVGERYADDTCLAVVAADGRQPTESDNRSGTAAIPDDPRLDDPEYAWVTEEVDRCACRCCHTAELGGPGVYYWDLDYAPVWSDSASSWTLSVFAGLTEEPAQTLPTSDLARLRAWLEAEELHRAAAP